MAGDNTSRKLFASGTLKALRLLLRAMDRRSIMGIMMLALGFPLGLLGAITTPMTSSEPWGWLCMLGGAALVIAGVLTLREAGSKKPRNA